MSEVKLIHGDCLEVMRGMDANSVDAVITDPPYYKVKDEPWDNQWDTPAGFLVWIGELCQQWERIIKPNGSLYVFASPQMAARVEVKIGEKFNVLNRIRWVKDAGWHNKAEKEALRSFLSPWEEIIFAEHYGADNIAKGEAGYEAKCDKLRGFVFEPLRAYLDGERKRAGVGSEAIMDWFASHGQPKYVTARHSFSRSQWALPTESNYLLLRKCLHELNHNGEYLRREYEYLRREYEDLRREYEDLRRPFNVTENVPNTDVWNYKTVAPREIKHPCEKPLPMMKHIITSSTRPRAKVVDCFMGSGTTGVACSETGRDFIGIELDQKYYTMAQKRIEAAQAQLQMFAPSGL